MNQSKFGQSKPGLAHDIQDVNIKLAESQYFYTDIKKKGCILYDSGNFKLAGKHRLKPDERRRIAQDYYNHWFKRAAEFWGHFEVDMEKIKNGC